MNEIRRMQARIDGFMKAHTNRNNRQEQPRVRTREGRPVCDICGRVGDVRQNCYARIDQRNQYQNPRNTQPHTRTGPRTAALEADGTTELVVAQFNQPNHQQTEQEAQPEGAYYARRSNPPIFWSTEVPRISTIQAVQPINYNCQPTQTVATHSDPAEEDQVRIISSHERYTIADDSLQSAPDQEPTHQRQELSSSNQETRVHSISNRNTQGSAMHKKIKPTQRSFPPNTPQRTAFVIGKINDCPTKLLIASGAYLGDKLRICQGSPS